MRRLEIATAALLLGIGTAVQAGPGTNAVYCLNFVNFCDGLQLDISGPGSFSGTWQNVDCVGTDVAVRGRVSQGVISVVCPDFFTCPIGYLWMFRMDVATLTFDMFGWDGVSQPFVNLIDEPFAVTPGACAFAEGTGIPSSLAR